MGARGLLLVALTAGAAVAAGCEPPPDFVTAHGVRFHLQGSTFISRAQAEEQEEEFLAALGEALGPKEQALGCVGQTLVVVVPEGPFTCAGFPDRRCAGEQDGAVLKVAATACPYGSAYTHELLHWLQQCLASRTDYEHAGPEWAALRALQDRAAARCPKDG